MTNLVLRDGVLDVREGFFVGAEQSNGFGFALDAPMREKSGTCVTVDYVIFVAVLVAS